MSTALRVVVDALVELGRYPEAVDAVLRSTSVRISPRRRVTRARAHGDLPGALDAMRRAVQRNGAASENNACDRAVWRTS
jgi:hypothetical protein